MKKFLVFFLFCSTLLATRSFGQTKIWLKGNTDIVVNISLPATSFRLSDKELRRVKMEVSLTNNSKSEIEIYPYTFSTVTNFGSWCLSLWDKGTAAFAYKLDRFDATHQRWDEVDVNYISSNVDIVEPPEGMVIEHKFIKEGEKFGEEREPFSEMNLKAGKYRLQVILGVKVRKDLFAMFSSNELEIEVSN